MTGKRKIVYISGPITGVNDYYANFVNAHIELHRAGFLVINPAEITNSLPKGLPWEAYMDTTLPLLRYCDAIYSLKGWENSPGARIEREYAARLGLEIMNEPDE